MTAVTKKTNNTVCLYCKEFIYMSKGCQGYLLQDPGAPPVRVRILWDPPTKSNISKLEAVQHSDYRHRSSVTAMMEDLGWEQLQTRPQQAKTIMLYRIVISRQHRYRSLQVPTQEDMPIDSLCHTTVSMPTRIPSTCPVSISGAAYQLSSSHRLP